MINDPTDGEPGQPYSPFDEGELFRLLADNSTDLIARHTPEGVCLYASPAASSLLGYDPAEFVGRSAADFVHPDDQHILMEARKAILAGGSTHSVTLRLRTKDGTYRWVESMSRTLRGADGRVIEIQSASRDVTERRRAEDALRTAEERFRTAFDHAPIGMALVASEGRFLRVNRALARMTGHSEEELLAQRMEDITHPEDRASLKTLVDQALAGSRDEFQLETRWMHASGHSGWGRLSASLLRDQAGAPLHFVVHIEDITQRKQAEEKLLHQALHDALTGLHNRILFMDRLTHALARSERQLAPVAVLFVDLDHFKDINDRYGHTFGDQILVAAAQKLESAVRPSDTVARIGGDEFAVLCEDMSAEKDAVRVAQRLGDALREPVIVGEREIMLSASIGIAFAQEGDNPDTLLKNADAAMYKVKEGGRGTYEIYLDAL
jgi:diguanylate cyclase (GGDEF)-like protein/PAS domain S-box-containing protein